MKLGIAIFPSLELQEKVNSYRKRYDSHYSVIAPHMTLKSHFEAADIDEVAQQVAAVAEHTSTFDIQINKVSNFAPVKGAVRRQEVSGRTGHKLECLFLFADQLDVLDRVFQGGEFLSNSCCDHRTE